MSKVRGAAQGRFGRVALLEIDRPVLRHAHPHCHALFKVGGADSCFEVNGRPYPLLDVTAVLVSAWQPHSYPYERWRGWSLVLALYIEPEWLSDLDGEFQSSGSPEFFPQPCVTLPRPMQTQVHTMAEALMAGEVEGEDILCMLESLMVAVIEHFSCWRELRGLTRRTAFRVSDFRIRRAIELMKRGLSNPIDFSETARESALSRAHFFELFKLNTGLTPNMFRNVLRMEAAYQALLDPQLSMRQISADLGFRAQAHFSRFFRDNLGVPPGEFRRSLFNLLRTEGRGHQRAIKAANSY